MTSGDTAFGAASRGAVLRCRAQGQIIACEVVWAEVVAGVSDGVALDAMLVAAGLEFSALERGTALTAGFAWRQYRQRGGRRERIVADFLIGAHAMVQADRLLTRDRGFQRAYFPELTVLDPLGG